MPRASELPKQIVKEVRDQLDWLGGYAQLLQLLALYPEEWMVRKEIYGHQFEIVSFNARSVGLVTSPTTELSVEVMKRFFSPHVPDGTRITKRGNMLVVTLPEDFSFYAGENRSGVK